MSVYLVPLRALRPEQIDSMAGNKEARKIWLAKWKDDPYATQVLPQFQKGDCAGKKGHMMEKYVFKKYAEISQNKGSAG